MPEILTVTPHRRPWRLLRRLGGSRRTTPILVATLALSVVLLAVGLGSGALTLHLPGRAAASPESRSPGPAPSSPPAATSGVSSSGRTGSGPTSRERRPGAATSGSAAEGDGPTQAGTPQIGGPVPDATQSPGPGRPDGPVTTTGRRPTQRSSPLRRAVDDAGHGAADTLRRVSPGLGQTADTGMNAVDNALTLVGVG